MLSLILSSKREFSQCSALCCTGLLDRPTSHFAPGLDTCLERVQSEHVAFASLFLSPCPGTLDGVDPACRRPRFAEYRRRKSSAVRSWTRALDEKLGASAIVSIVSPRCGELSPRALTIKVQIACLGEVPIFTIRSLVSSIFETVSDNGVS